MEKKLLAYQISGQTVGINIQSWMDTDLNGNEAFKIITSGETIPSGYVDITSIENWNNIGIVIANDYLVIKFEIRDIINKIGWSGLTSTEKDLGIKYYSYPDTTTAVTHLMMTKNMSQEQAQEHLLLAWHKHHGNITISCKQRWFYVKIIVLQYLNFNDTEDVLNTIEPLVFAYHDMGRLGINYGDKKDGLMDYIESTNAFSSQGLRENNYVLIKGTWDEFITAMKNVFIWGIYNKYEDFTT